MAFGDSITEGYGVKEGFVSFLCAKIAGTRPALDLLTVNKGVSGDNSRDGLSRLDRDVLQFHPDIVTVNFGVNDAFSGITPGMFADNLVRMAQRIFAVGCSRVVFLSSEVIPEAPAQRAVLPYWNAMREAARKAGCAYADVHGRWAREIGAGRPEKDLIIPGDLHPSEEGHRIIADAVYEAMQENGILEGL